MTGICATPILQQIETPRWDVMICTGKAGKVGAPTMYQRNEIDLRLAIAGAIDEARIPYDYDGSISIAVGRHIPEAA